MEQLGLAFAAASVQMSENIPQRSPLIGSTRNALDDDDSGQVELVDGPPIKRHIFELSEFKVDEPNPHLLRVMVGFERTYLTNLKEGREKQITEPQLLARQMIFRREFELTHFHFLFEMYYSRSSSKLKIGIRVLRRDSPKKLGLAELAIHYYNMSRWKSEPYKQVDHERSTASADEYWFVMFSSDKYLEDRNIYFDIKLQYRQKPTGLNPRRFSGLENVGNTCYMNSFLQALFFIKPLRKLIFECNPQGNQFVLQLQRTFAAMMQADGSTVNPKQLVQGTEWSRQFQFEQQDVDQFKRHMFEEVEKINKNILDLFEIESLSSVYCKDVQYKNDIKSTNLEIGLQVIDHNKRPLENIQKSIEAICKEECLDAEVETEKFGKRVGYKTHAYTRLPPVLFINLKRYEYDSGSLHKILAKFTYNNELDLTKHIVNGEDQRYTLYGVMVHRGTSVTSGHYYSIINTSTQQSKPQWYKFNDYIVTEVEEEQVTEDNYGGRQDSYQFSTESEEFLPKTITKQATAYVLIYIKTKFFNDMQGTTLSVPRHLLKATGSTVHNQNGIDDKVYVMLLDDLLDKVPSIFSPKVFEYGREVTVRLDQTLQMQLPELKASFEKSEGTLWRVSLTSKSVVNVLRQYNNEQFPAKYMLFGDHPKSSQKKEKFYLLFVPNSHNLSFVSQDRLPYLIATNDLVITFINLSWRGQQERYITKLQSAAVFPQADKRTALDDLLKNDHPEQVIIQNGKLQIVGDIEFRRKEMYCQLVRSYFSFTLEEHDTRS